MYTYSVTTVHAHLYIITYLYIQLETDGAVVEEGSSSSGQRQSVTSAWALGQLGDIGGYPDEL